MENYFKAIEEAYEVLIDPDRRRIYDNTYDVDDEIATDCAPQDFKVFGSSFMKNGCWSANQPVPSLRDDKTSIKEVDNFYEFWYNFKSRRMFPHADKFNLEKAESKAQRSRMERRIRTLHDKARKEESACIHSLVENAYKQDPRIMRRKEEEKTEKQRKKDVEVLAKKKKEEDKKAAEVASQQKKVREKSHAPKKGHAPKSENPRRKEEEKAKKQWEKEAKVLANKMQEEEAARIAEEERCREEEEDKKAAEVASWQKMVRKNEEKLLPKEKTRLHEPTAPVLSQHLLDLTEKDVERLSKSSGKKAEVKKSNAGSPPDSPS